MGIPLLHVETATNTVNIYGDLGVTSCINVGSGETASNFVPYTEAQLNVYPDVYNSGNAITLATVDGYSLNTVKGWIKYQTSGGINTAFDSALVGGTVKSWQWEPIISAASGRIYLKTVDLYNTPGLPASGLNPIQLQFDYINSSYNVGDVVSGENPSAHNYFPNHGTVVSKVDVVKINGSAVIYGDLGVTGYITTNDGRVGIGTNSPEAPLHITSYKYTAVSGGVGPGVAIAASGGPIGTHPYLSTATLGGYIYTSLLQDPQTNAQGSIPAGLLDTYGTITGYNGSGGNTGRLMSAYLVGGIMTLDTYYFASDERIKTNIKTALSEQSLSLLREIKCKNFNFKDTYARGRESTIGFIAQEIKKVLPSAINTQRSIIPNKLRLSKNHNWETINENSSSTKYKLTINDLNETYGNKLFRFHVNNNNGEEEKHLEVRSLENEPNSFIFDKKYTNIFIYGNEVSDLHGLDNEPLVALNFSATQEIDKIQQEEKTKLEAAGAKITTLEAENIQLRDRLSAIETRLVALEAK